MVVLRAKFDGQNIEVPSEMRGTVSGDVLVVYLPGEPLLYSPGALFSSIWDVVGKAPHQRTAADINSQVRTDRDSWGEW